MAFDTPTRNRLLKTVNACRKLLTEDFDDQLRGRFGIYADEGRVREIDQLTSLNDVEQETARLLRERITHIAAGKGSDAVSDAVERILREQAFTIMNRFAAIRMAEERKIISQSVGAGLQSKGFRVFEQAAGAALGTQYERYLVYLDCLFDELSLDLGVLFDRSDALGLLFPSESAVRELFDELNHPDIAPLWAEDETIGWIYQYWNTEADRRAARYDENGKPKAPQNSRELAVRNQFFTPRYVVEFLTDNTLGRIWYDMTKGQTRLAEQCRYLVRRPNEIFLGHPDLLDVLQEAAPWVQEAIRTANFSQLPENPTVRDLSDLALAIDGYGEMERRQRSWDEYVESFFNPQAEASGRDGAPWKGDAFELWCALFAYQRGVLRNGYFQATGPAADDPVLRYLWPALRSALIEPPGEISQDELLKQPVFIPHRPIKDPREIRLLDPACGSMHFGLYAFDLFETIYAEAWERSSVPPEDFGYQPSPILDHQSVRASESETARSNYGGEQLPLAQAEILIAAESDAGDGVEAGMPYLVNPGTIFRVAESLRVPVSSFDYRSFVREGKITEDQGERFLRETGAFDFDDIPAVSKDDAREQFHLEIPRLIIEHNIHGVDIDPRAAQIAGLSLWLRAQKTWKDTLAAERPDIRSSNIVCAEPMPGSEEMLDEFIASLEPPEERDALGRLVKEVFDKMQLAGEAGTLLKIEEEIRTAIEGAREKWEKLQRHPPELFSTDEFNRVTDQPELSNLDTAIRAPGSQLSGDFFETAEERIYAALRDYAESAEAGDYQRRLFAEDAAHGFAFIDLCRQRYDAVVMNPPFGEQALNVAHYTDTNYKSAKADLYAAFVTRGLSLLSDAGAVGVIASRLGLFISSLSTWRDQCFFGASRLGLLADLGHGVLDNALVEAASYVMWSNSQLSILASAQALDTAEKGERILEAFKGQSGTEFFISPHSEFLNFPYHPIAYWIPSGLAGTLFKNDELKQRDAAACVGLQTDDDFRFLRLAWEAPSDEVIDSWRHFAKGGEYSPFYDDIHLLVNWRNEASELRAFIERKYSWTKRASSAGRYGDPGLTFPERTTSEFSPRPLPRGTIFSIAGQAVFGDSKATTGTLLSLFYTRIYRIIIELFVGGGDTVESGSAARHYKAGIVAKSPCPALSGEVAQALSERGLLAASIAHNLFTDDETSRHFKGLTHLNSESISSVVSERISSREDAWVQLEKLTGENEDLALKAYGVSPSEEGYVETLYGPHPASYPSDPIDCDLGDYFTAKIDDLVDRVTTEIASTRQHSKLSHWTERRYEMVAHLLQRPVSAVVNARREQGIVTSEEKKWCASSLCAWCIGVTLGRWDVRYATGERQPPELPDPFDPLPVCPPGMLQNADGLPAAPEDVPDDYPLRITWPGILVDDDGHPEDIVTRVRDALAVIWGDKADAIEAEACEILKVKAKPRENLDALRVYFRDPNRFFKDHLARYSKSRRKAPIYWPLSTESGSYTLWIYYHRLDSQTIFTCIDMVELKREEIGRDIESLRTRIGTEGSAEERQKLEDLITFQSELKTFHDRLLEVTKLPYRPNLNDGVQITAAPLWQLFRNNEWQKVLKKTWDELAKKEKYDWAHLAMTIWPERVVPKCAKDRSLAIAHGIEDLLWVPDLSSKKADKLRPLKSPDQEIKLLKQASRSQQDLDQATGDPAAAKELNLRTHLWIENPAGIWRRRTPPREEVETEVSRRQSR